ncbi:hypothetical protein HK107_03855 [Parvularcula sp. ZS-1/3]|uniref:DUF4339 domain-containing protein n=1 Tax=Parvularcula mediterranea TaxID=2732508 RepID=A0A7Y3W468_9PROT|nr:hypothetical protein [Parvularcula mediterranea]NNU15455.1 hypothetical protein [Parvularcula mediterranea]
MATENWCMNVGERIYGPYSTDQLKDFVGQKRLAYHSMVAPAGSRDFRPALQYSELRAFFRGEGAVAEAQPQTGAVHLAIFGSDDAAAKANSQLFAALPEARPLSGSAYMIVSPKSADDLRDSLSQTLGAMERTIIVTLGDAEISSHGVSLQEHETLKAMLGS